MGEGLMDITTRHIRHDWPEWIDWNNQKSVKTMCGVRSRPGLCGVPGVTNQSAVVEKNGRKVWGWCMRCVVATFPYYLPPALTVDVTSQAILDLHAKAREEIKNQYVASVKARLESAVKDGRIQSTIFLRDHLRDLTPPQSS